MGEGAPEHGLFGMREENVARRIEYEMQQRGWSQERLAKEMSEAGFPVHQSAISKIINRRDGKRRTIGVDEAIGFAKVFGVSLESLVAPIFAARSAEARTAMGQIQKLLEQRVLVMAEMSELWDRLKELLRDDEVVEALVGQLQEQEGVSGDVARFTLVGWLEGSFIKGSALDSIHPDDYASMEDVLSRQIEVIDRLGELLNSDGFTPAAGEAFLEEHADDVRESALPLGGKLIGYLQARNRGEPLPADRLKWANYWIDITRSSLQELIEMGRAAMDHEAP